MSVGQIIASREANGAITAVTVGSSRLQYFNRPKDRLSSLPSHQMFAPSLDVPSKKISTANIVYSVSKREVKILWLWS